MSGENAQNTADAVRRAVALCIQSWHCSQGVIPPPCSDDCSCWDSAGPIMAAHKRADPLASNEIKRLRDALDTAARRFELLALGHPGASAAVGAKEAREAAHGP